MNVIEIEGQARLRAVFSVLSDLRPHLSFEDFEYLYSESRRRDQYSIFGAFVEDECVGLIGSRVLFDFVHGKHLYVDDLVVKPTYRSKGIGAKLLKFAEGVAKENGCTNLRLCTGVSNEGGKRFYEREGWQMRSVVYKKKL